MKMPVPALASRLPGKISRLVLPNQLPLMRMAFLSTSS